MISQAASTEIIPRCTPQWPLEGGLPVHLNRLTTIQHIKPQSCKSTHCWFLNICVIAVKSKGRFNWHFYMYYILQNTCTTTGIQNVFRSVRALEVYHYLNWMTGLSHTLFPFLFYLLPRTHKIPVRGRREELHHLQQEHCVSWLDGECRFKSAHMHTCICICMKWGVQKQGRGREEEKEGPFHLQIPEHYKVVTLPRSACQAIFRSQSLAVWGFQSFTCW